MADAPRQRTLAGRTQTLHGVGLHAGRPCSVILAPGAPGAGLVFQRADEPGSPDIPANADRIVPAERCTALRSGTAEVRTVEHLLAACVLAGLDNALLLVEGGEVPAADGSAAPFLELIEHVGLVEQDAPRRARRLAQTVALEDPAGWTIRAESAPGPAWSFRFRGGGRLDGTEAAFDPARDDPRLVATARTFCYETEITALRARGLGQGGTAENVLVLRADGSAVNGERMAGEAVRHKLLDLIGDCALAGPAPMARVTASGSGHAAHARFVRALGPHLVREEAPRAHA